MSAARVAVAACALWASAALAEPAPAQLEPGASARGEAERPPQLEPVAAQVAALLTPRHGRADRVALEALTADAATHVRRIAADPHSPGPTRAGAVAALVDWPDAATLAALVGLLEASETPEPLRRRAARSLGTAFGPQARPHLAPWLDDPSVERRLTAIEAIARIPGAESYDLLSARRPREANPAVKAALAEWLYGPLRAGATLR